MLKPSELSPEGQHLLFAKLYAKYKADITRQQNDNEIFQEEIVRLKKKERSQEKMFDQMFTTYKTDIEKSQQQIRTQELQIQHLKDRIIAKDQQMNEMHEFDSGGD